MSESKLSAEELQAIREELKNEILNDLKTEKEKNAALEEARRQEEEQQYQEYVEKMKNSPDPWVDVKGWVHTNDGVKIDLDWNDAWIKYLRSQGITGTDDEQVVQKWLALISHDMAGRMADDMMSEGDYA